MPDHPESEISILQHKAEEAKAKIRYSNLGDVLGDESRRFKRAVLALSVIALVVSRYKLAIKEIPWLSIPAPADAENLVPTLVLAALAYHLVGFTLHAWADIWRWMLAQGDQQWRGQADQVYEINHKIHRLTQSIEQAQGMGRPDAVGGAVRTRDNAIEVADAAIKEFESLRGAVVRTHKGKRLTAWVWDFSLPVTAALVGMFFLVLHLLYP